MTHRTALRRAALLTIAVGGVLAPASVAVASQPPADRPVPLFASDASPAPAPGDGGQRVTLVPAAPRGGGAAGGATPTPAPPSGLRETPEAAVEDAGTRAAPRGGVAAGERPAERGGSGALVGSAAGLLMLAGAGGFVVRRRTAGRPGV
ncbi:hypothetical protein [Streptomyces sp. NPDC049906]|uniref:hypothetical protein n=1 Tax=Streptomyces sp. NPDC049906 TaxID=3155656 RepID=UPI003436E6D1